MEETERSTKSHQKHKQQHEDDIVAPKVQQKVWSWGAGTEGQLGTEKLQDEHTPQLITSLSSFNPISFLSCGGAHVIALTLCGEVLSWGRGSSGQLGHGEVVPNCLYPKLVDSLSCVNICHVSAGWSHSGFVSGFALFGTKLLTPSDSGCLFTCGDGTFGQLGHGDYKSYSSPVEVSFFGSKHVKQVACGMRHSLVLVEGSSGDKLYGFGSGKRGQLGISKDKVRSLSVPQPCLGFEGARVVTVTANGDHSAALSADGHLYAWGRGFSGSEDVCVPESLHTSSSFKQTTLGWNHALVLTEEGEAFMLGGSHHGVLSEPQKMAHDHNLSGLSNLSKVPGLHEKKAVQVAAGAEHSALVTDCGEICTWGWGEHGQLGLGNSNDQTSPQLVDLEHIHDHNSIMTSVYCGSGFTFALATEAAM